ncbi:g5351 [Coccomyxa elongata]
MLGRLGAASKKASTEAQKESTSILGVIKDDVDSADRDVVRCTASSQDGLFDVTSELLKCNSEQEKKLPTSTCSNGGRAQSRRECRGLSSTGTPD